MAVTVSTNNYLAVDDCEDSGTWTGETPADVTDFYKEGTQCCGFTVRGIGDNDIYITGTFNLSGKHLRCWMMSTALKEMNATSFYLSDGTNTGYYEVIPSGDYPGGWYNMVLDCDRTPTSGSQPTLTAITTIGIRFNHASLAKNAQNTWIDNVMCADGLTAYGDDTGGYFDFDNILSADENTTNGWGVIRKIGGVYYLTGELTFGDTASAATKFNAKSAVIVFEDRPVNSNLYNFTVVDSGTGTTEFILGELSGTSGISGCIVRTESSSQTAKFDVVATDTDISDFKLYGSTFLGADSISFPLTATNNEVINCNFEACGQVDPSTCELKKCNFIATTDTDAALLWNGSIDIEECNFIANTLGAGIEHPAQGSFNYTGLVGSGNTYDILYSAAASAGVLTINADSDSSVSTYEITNPTGNSVSIIATKTLSIHVEDEGGSNVVGAQVYIQKTSPTQFTSHASNNSQGDLTFECTAALDTDTNASGWFTVFDASESKQHYYRYASKDQAAGIFTLNAKVSGTCEAGGSATLLNDTGIGAMDVKEGDTIRNETAGGWAKVLVVDTNSVTTTSLSTGTWATGQTWSVHSLAVNYGSSDTAYWLIMNEETDASGDATGSFNYQGDRPIIIRIRDSTAGTRYLPFKTSGNILTSGYGLTAVMIEDSIVT